jgi:drug/metabolite transporter (DMT)-like permease
MAGPWLASLVAWWVLRESLTAVQVAGGVVVLAGIVLAETARTQSAAPAPFEV